MKVVGISVTNKALLLPAVLIVAFFLVVLGMRPPQLQKINKPRIHHRDVVQSQDKASQAGVEKYVPTAEPCRCVELAELSPSYRISLIHLEVRNSDLIAVSFLPSRAPPAFPV